MVVATGAMHRHTQHTTTQGSQHVIEIVMTPLGIVLFAELHPRPSPQEPGGNESLVSDVVELVTSDLLLQKLVVGFVLIVGVNDIVAIPPGIGPNIVLFKPG